MGSSAVAVALPASTVAAVATLIISAFPKVTQPFTTIKAASVVSWNRAGPAALLTAPSHQLATAYASYKKKTKLQDGVSITIECQIVLSSKERNADMEA